jgi:flagellar M-ring protein FliF
MNPFLRNLGAFLRRLTPGQQLGLGVVLIGGVALLVTIAMWANKPDYALLFDDLDPDDANRSVEALRERGIKYELGDQGTAIYVPRDRVYELRLEFAGEGLVTRGPIGYNLFDQNTLGMRRLAGRGIQRDRYPAL